MSEKIKVLAVASGGGHWIQLLRLQRSFADAEIVFVSTHSSYSKESFIRYYTVTDASRWNKFKLVKMAYEMKTIIKREKPDFIISTGAAPGLLAILWGKVYGSKNIWVDSIANVEKLSLSGRLAIRLSDLHLTQWEHLASSKTLYKGTVLS